MEAMGFFVTHKYLYHNSEKKLRVVSAGLDFVARKKFLNLPTLASGILNIC
jgi:hypothetical protein